MKHLLPFLAILLAACSAPIEEDRFVAAFRCGPDIVFDAWHRGESLQLVFADKMHVLRAVGDGHYVGAGVEAWKRDKTLELRLDAERHECRPDSSVMQAIASGVDYRALGQEPGWLLEIIEGDRFSLHFDYGGHVVTLPFTTPRTSQGTVGYVVEEGGRRLQVTLVTAPCMDVMSGQPYPDIVEVHYRDATLERQLSGCGRPLPMQ